MLLLNLLNHRQLSKPLKKHENEKADEGKRLNFFKQHEKL